MGRWLKFLKIPVAGVILLFLSFGLYFNYALYYRPLIILKNGDRVEQELLYQLQHLKDALEKGAGQEMQAIFPEGYVFIYSLYGLAWYDFAEHVKDEALRSQAVREIDYALKKVHSDEGREVFYKQLSVPYGVFYTGWASLLLGSKLALQKPANRRPEEISEYRGNCDAVALALGKSPTPYLESYWRAAWPADTTAAMGALALHDKIFEKRYQGVIARWVRRVQEKLDPRTGLMPHSAHYKTGLSGGGPRGSSQSLINSFLPDIDPEFARLHFQRYRKFFLTTRLGLPGVREYPAEVSGSGDIDSGPLAFRVGPAATIVGIRAMVKNKELGTALGLRSGIEAAGFAYVSGEKKKYLFGLMPMADAFIAWTLTRQVYAVEADPFRFIKFQLISLLLLLICFLALFFILRKK